MSDGEFYQAFKRRMDWVGLPVPVSLFGTLSAAIASTGAIAGAIAKIGMTATMSEILLTIPFAAGGVTVAAGIAEITAALGAVAAAFYLGACIGALIGAAQDVYGPTVVGKISIWLRDLSEALGTLASTFMDKVLREYPDLAPMRMSASQVRSLMIASSNRAYA